MNDAESTFRQTTMPEALTGLDAELYAALGECGRIIEAMPWWDERKKRINDALANIGLEALLEPTDAMRRTRDFVVGVLIVAHQRRIFDQHWESTAVALGGESRT